MSAAPRDDRHGGCVLFDCAGAVVLPLFVWLASDAANDADATAARVARDLEFDGVDDPRLRVSAMQFCRDGLLQLSASSTMEPGGPLVLTLLWLARGVPQCAAVIDRALAVADVIAVNVTVGDAGIVFDLPGLRQKRVLH